MKVIQGNLLTLAMENSFDVIIHGCNCFCTMGAGIAAQIAKSFPEAYEVDCLTLPGDRRKLGSLTSAEIVRPNVQFIIVNGYTQFGFGSNPPSVDYEAVRSVFRLVKSFYRNKRIGYPQIGAGLAGGDWNLITSIIEEELQGEDHTCVEYKP